MMRARKVGYALIFGFSVVALPMRAMDSIDHQPIDALRTALKNNGQVRIAQGTQNILTNDDKGALAPLGALLMLTTNKGTGEWTVSVLNSKTVGSTALVGTTLQQISSDQPQAVATFDPAKAEAVLKQMNARDSGYYPDEVARLTKTGCKRVYCGNVTFTLPSALSVAEAYNAYAIDNNVMTLNVDGQTLKITQGALRKVLVNRVHELETERAELQASNSDPNKLAQTNDLLAKYGTEKCQLGDDASPNFSVLNPVWMDVLQASDGAFHILVVDQNGACFEIASGSDFGPNV